jgi:hypothetical protein
VVTDRADQVEITSDAGSGARFFDENKADRGWASKVTRRAQSIGRLTVLDVVTTEPLLAAFLICLDKAHLRVERTDVFGAAYVFAWASGYDNGGQIRIQGVLVDA